MRFSLLVGSCIACLANSSAAAQATAPTTGDFLNRYDTAYNTLIVEKKGSIVELRSNIANLYFRESAVDLGDPDKLIVPYVETLFAAAMFQPNPSRALMIGLGGGTFNRVFGQAYPQASLTTVELDRKVQELATEHMGFTTSARNTVTIGDGRMIIRRNREPKYDWLIVDAYKGNTVPPHLKTVEFYKEVARCLAPGGVAAFNLQDSTKLFDFDVATLEAAFPQVMYFKVPDAPNTIAIASASATPRLEDQLKSFDAKNAPTALRKRVDFDRIAASRQRPQRVTDAKVMTDDFAPAEYYQVVSRARPSR
ncbi:MAG TPA: fused MFS/spermidine synthase [Chthoniobacterales bacterium]|nr:fused MFS/spermidine synthase [Chthoniobacterales bacterium]